MPDNSEINYFSDLTWLQGKAAFCENEEQLAFHIVNHTIKIVPYSQALLWRETRFGIKIIALSGITAINHSSPYISLLEQKIIPKLIDNHDEIAKINTEQYSELVEGYGGYLFPWCLWLPFYSLEENKRKNINYKIKSGLILFSKHDWDEGQLDKILNIVNYYRYLWDLFLKQSDYNIDKKRRMRIIKWSTAAVISLSMLMPISESIKAPAKIAPSNPVVVTTALPGYIAKIYVKPNQIVKKDDLLFKLDTVELTREYQQSVSNLNIVKERYNNTYRQSYHDPQSKAELKVLESEIKLAGSDVLYRKKLLENAIVRADTDGTVIISDPKSWLGRNIEVGEKIMLIAAENKKQLDITIPVDAMIDLPEQTTVKFYPSSKPLDAINGRILFVNKKADVQHDGQLAYYTVARLDNEQSKNHEYGLTGEVKIYGKKVILGYHLFRRPILWLRKLLGV